MRAIVVMFDTLNRKFLPPYGAEGVHAPNFERLVARSVTYENCYGGSMPCMPARREMHTGRYNFLHRGWGPLEPFDDSVPQLLTDAGVYTHLVTDHQHYWLDGGATYHPRFRTFEFFRGQEGDEWKGHVADPDLSHIAPYASNHELRRQDAINRTYMADEADHPQTLTFDAGLHFINTNAAEQDWFVQIETFDPHEPFFSYADYHRLYGQDSLDRDFDWPDYKQVTESEEELAHLRRRYQALLSMCDANLGRVLHAMDAHDMWEDTALIVCTDHGLLLGEHEWLGKNVPPFYDETIHTPLFVWDPREKRAGERERGLVQTIDLGPTLLDLFGLGLTGDMEGRPLPSLREGSEGEREAALFGIHGGHVNVTDGRYVYMRACVTADNQPLSEYTLMPTNMRGRFTSEALREAELLPPLPFTKDMPVLKVPAFAPTNPAAFGHLLFDLETDPQQLNPLDDADVELRMAGLLVELMRANHAPSEQYVRLGLPASGPVDESHLVLAGAGPGAAGAGDAVGEDASQPPPETFDPATFEGTPVATLTVAQILDDPAYREVARGVLGPIVDGPLPPDAREMTLVQIATVTFGMVPPEALHAINEGLSAPAD